MYPNTLKFIQAYSSMDGFPPSLLCPDGCDLSDFLVSGRDSYDNCDECDVCWAVTNAQQRSNMISNSGRVTGKQLL